MLSGTGRATCCHEPLCYRKGFDHTTEHAGSGKGLWNNGIMEWIVRISAMGNYFEESRGKSLLSFILSISVPEKQLA